MPPTSPFSRSTLPNKSYFVHLQNCDNFTLTILRFDVKNQEDKIYFTCRCTMNQVLPLNAFQQKCDCLNANEKEKRENRRISLKEENNLNHSSCDDAKRFLNHVNFPDVEKGKRVRIAANLKLSQYFSRRNWRKIFRFSVLALCGSESACENLRCKTFWVIVRSPWKATFAIRRFFARRARRRAWESLH